jgi:teichuronic acid biosynthesis glycosyltransferase TuaC
MSIGPGEQRPRVLVVTSEWPRPELPRAVPFLVEQVDSLREAGVDVEVFAFRGRGRPLHYLRAWRELRRRHRLRDYDLVHAHFGQGGVVALPCPVPLVVTLHGSDLHGLVGSTGRYSSAGRALAAVSRWVARHASEVILVSEHLSTMLPGIGHATIPCAIDRSRFRPQSRGEARSALGLDPDRKLILFGADPANPIKRFELARETVELVRQSIDCDLLLLRGVDHSQVPLYLNASDCLLMTSSHEGSPMVVKEAVACGLPIVSIRVGDVAERFGALAGCEVHASDRPAVLAQAVCRVLLDGRRVDAGTTLDSLGHERVTEQIVSVYERALAGARWRLARQPEAPSTGAE